MQILTDKNVVFAIGTIIEAGRWENDPTMDAYRIFNGENYQYAVIADFELYTVESVPEDFVPNKYCYNEEKGWQLNPDYKSMTEERYTLDEAAAILASEVNK